MKKSLVQLDLNLFLHCTAGTRNPDFGYQFHHHHCGAILSVHSLLVIQDQLVQQYIKNVFSRQHSVSSKLPKLSPKYSDNYHAKNKHEGMDHFWRALHHWVTHSWPKNLKKSKPKKLMKSNKSISRFFFYQIPFFAISKMA